MIVKAIKKNGKGKYTVTIDDKSYVFSDNIIVEYRLVEGHETTDIEIDNAIKSEELESYYNKALNYTLKYGKCENEVRDYLFKKNVSYLGVNAIIKRLKANRVLVDDKLIDSLINSYIRNGNGKQMIYQKLIQKGFNKDMIEEHIKLIDYEYYLECLNKLYSKIKNKYDKEEPKIRIMKIKRYLYQRGYSTNDIECLDL